MQHYQSTPPVSSNMDIVASPSFSELDEQTNFLNVLKTLDNQFNFCENKIFKPSSTLLRENQNSFSKSFSQASPTAAELLNSAQYNDRHEIQASNQQSPPKEMVLHVKNLDYKISSDEWKRILTENFKKHCKDVSFWKNFLISLLFKNFIFLFKKLISVNVVTNVDKSLLGIVKLGSKDDVKLAISGLHHKKIGYKRLNVAVALSPVTNSPKYFNLFFS